MGLLPICLNMLTLAANDSIWNTLYFKSGCVYLLLCIDNCEMYQ